MSYLLFHFLINYITLGRKSTLLKMLDDHCAQENKVIEENSTTASEFNFLYLPIDFKYIYIYIYVFFSCFFYKIRV